MDEIERNSLNPNEIMTGPIFGLNLVFVPFNLDSLSYIFVKE